MRPPSHYVSNVYSLNPNDPRMNDQKNSLLIACILEDESEEEYENAKERKTPAEFEIIKQRILAHVRVQHLQLNDLRYAWIQRLVSKIISQALSDLQHARQSVREFDEQKYLDAVKTLNSGFSSDSEIVKKLINRVWQPDLLYFSLQLFMTHIETDPIQQLLHHLRVHCHESIFIFNTDL